MILLFSSLVIAEDEKATIFANQTYNNLGSWFGISGYEHNPELNPIPGWNPVNDWEIQQCQLRMYSEGEPDYSNADSGSGYYFSDGVQITLQAERRSTPEENRFENNIGWYIQPFVEEKSYTITLTYESGLEKDISEIADSFKDLKAPVGGSSAFYAWVDDQKVISAKIVIVGVEEFSASFVDKKETE